MDFAVLSFDRNDELHVVSWHDTAEEAVTAANIAAATTTDDVVFRAASSGPDGLWRSLSDEPLHHPGGEHDGGLDAPDIDFDNPPPARFVHVGQEVYEVVTDPDDTDFGLRIGID